MNNKEINLARIVAMQVINHANSGHSGMASGVADILGILFGEFLKFNPNNPTWLGRDKFVLSAGHGCAILYSYLHLLGYNISMDDLMQFRQIKSKTAGHPEKDIDIGIEFTTGPLGQGIASAAGFALSMKMMQSKIHNDLFNSKIYCLVGDGCLMEGISYEALSFIKNYNLDNIVIIFDNNNACIDDNVSNITKENITKRFENFGFDCLEIDGHNLSEIRQAFTFAKSQKKPIFINATTKIGFGSFMESNNKAHGAVFSSDEISKMMEKFDISYDDLTEHSELKQSYKNKWRHCESYYNQWQKISTEINLQEKIDKFFDKSNIINALNKKRGELLQNGAYLTPNATRKMFGNILSDMLQISQCVVSGSADVGDSTQLYIKHSNKISATDFNGNYISYGVREHAMGAISNALSIDGFVTFCGTFLVFSDYMRCPIRIAAMQQNGNIFVFSHDSIFVGEDGMTHQPVEHLAGLESIPNLHVFRPANMIEMLESFDVILKNNLTSCIITTRQNVDTFAIDVYEENNNNVKYGFYNVKNSDNLDILILSNGSELNLAEKVAKKLETDHKIYCNIVSTPCQSLFDKQSSVYKNKILMTDKKILRVAIYAASSEYIAKYMNINDLYISQEEFGLSGKYQDIVNHFGFTIDAIVEKIISVIKK